MQGSPTFETPNPETAADQKASTPMMGQWHACKAAAGDALLFFRMGDFYESFHDDAVIISRELDLTLTKRQEIPMCGVPHHTSEGYVDRLIAKGYRVAIAEQTEDPKKAKGLVKREVVRIVTPGTVISSSLLTDTNNNFIAAVAQVGKIYGIAILDLTTADFRALEVINEQELLNELCRLQPSEIVLSLKFQDKHKALIEEMRKMFTFVVSSHDDWRFDHKTAHDFLANHMGVKSLDGFGLSGMVTAINAAGAILSYIQDILCLPITHIQKISPYSTTAYMSVDRSTQRHLELTESLSDRTKRGTLLSVLDKTCTPMGARLIRQWIKQPLTDASSINLRLDAVEALKNHSHIIEQSMQLMDHVRDLERLIMRVCSGYATPKDLIALKNSYEPIPHLKSLLSTVAKKSALISQQDALIEPLPEMIALIGAAISDDPPLRVSDGRVIKDGYHPELDELREISRDSKTWLARYQNELKESTGIKTLKVGFNKMFGYYIEVSKGQADKMPDTFNRRQTLVNAERYITPELKEYENKVMHAEERSDAIEAEIFFHIRTQAASYGQRVLKTAQALAMIDVLQALASAANDYGYVRPVIHESSAIEIKSGRHPVIEAAATDERFIPNDTLLDDQDNRLLLITGPNMAGKSTYIRQVALITIMAHMGSFVPAESAHIGIVDKVFSRIGASDDLSRGQSTFMVEMMETANILNNATSRSLIILDEIGRGTSTYDGISIAWSVAEYLLTAENRMAKTLFATHYWELTKLEEKVHGAKNYNVAVHETDDSIIFLRKIVRGGTDKSYGIHVGRLAGLPSDVIERAKEILVHLEENANRKSAFEPAQPKRPTAKSKMKVAAANMQLTFFN